jgi:hypothetical protein
MCLSVCITGLLFRGAVCADVKFQVIATSDQEIPGGHGEVFGDISVYRNVAPGGLVTFQSVGEGTASTNLWLWDQDNYEQIVGPATPFRDSWAQFSGPLNRHGEVLFVSQDKTGAAVVGHYADGLSNVLVRDGDPVLGLPPQVVVQGAFPVAIRDDGTVRIRARLEGPGIGLDNNHAVLFGNRDSVALWLRAGDAAPGLPGYQLDCLCASLEKALPLYVVDPANPDDEKLGAWLNYGQNLDLLVVEGMPIPDSDLVLDRLASVQANQTDDIMFLGRAHDTNTKTSVAGVWYGTPGDYELILPENEERRYLRGTLSGDNAVLVASSNTAGVASVDSLVTLDVTLPDSLRVLAMQGELAPGTDRFFNDFISAPVNSRGDVFFTARTVLNQSGIDRGLWVLPAGAEEPELLAIEGEMFDLGGGDLRQISSLRGLGPLTDDGYATLQLTFEDGSSGVFLYQFVPEPSGFSLVAFALASLWLRRTSVAV